MWRGDVVSKKSSGRRREGAGVGRGAGAEYAGEDDGCAAEKEGNPVWSNRHVPAPGTWSKSMKEIRCHPSPYPTE